MKYFKNISGQVFAFENDGSQDDLIAEDMVLISEEEVVELTSKSPADRRKGSKESIDLAAGSARARFISPGTLIDAEYFQAEDAARTFADNGYAGAVPASVQSWADATGMTVQQSAEDILTTASQWRNLLDQIRAIRLSGKAAIDAAEDIDIESTAQVYIEQLDAMAPA